MRSSAISDGGSSGGDRFFENRAKSAVDIDGVRRRRGARLPHWERDGGIYAVCFRLAGTRPRSALRPPETEEVSHLRDLDAARLVLGTLAEFDGKRYELFAACVMPNHVHVVVRPFEGVALPSVLRYWKSRSATLVNRILRRSGTLWQRESYDHLVRDEDDLGAQISYTIENPERAGLSSEGRIWTSPKLSSGFATPDCEVSPEEHRLKADATRVEGRSFASL